MLDYSTWGYFPCLSSSCHLPQRRGGGEPQQEATQYGNQPQQGKCSQDARIEIISPLIIHGMGHPQKVKPSPAAVPYCLEL